jgi:hypothetical protein
MHAWHPQSVFALYHAQNEAITAYCNNEEAAYGTGVARTNAWLHFSFSVRGVLGGYVAVARHSAIQAGGPGTIDVNSASVLPHICFLFFVASTVQCCPRWSKMNKVAGEMNIDESRA